VARLVGPRRKVNALRVASQRSTATMTLAEWAEYMERAERLEGEEVLNLISLINEQMWVGHFGLWEDEGVVLFRHTLLLTGGVEPTLEQCEAALQVGVSACERYFQSFNFVLWAGKSADEALTTALFETHGEA
jgi:hypothetical protein